jgi:VanZ family protein
MRVVVRALPWIAIGAIAVLSLLPGQDRPHTVFPSQLEHIAAYAVASTMFALVYAVDIRLVMIEVLFILYGSLLEFCQLFIPGRQGRVIDVVADAVGAFIGLVAASIIERVFRAWLVRIRHRLGQGPLPVK